MKTPKSIQVTVKYDEELQKIVGEGSHPVFLGESSTILWLIESVLTSYPEIKYKYPAGKLRFLLNKEEIRGDTVLFENDVVLFKVFNE